MRTRIPILLMMGLAGMAPAEAAVRYPAPVERWRTRIEQKAAGMDLPIDFLLTWVKHESYGNPCSLGVPGREAGIGQTWHPDDDRFGATFDELRAACVSGTQKEARPLTEAEKDLQVTSLVGLVNAEKTGGVVGATDDSPDAPVTGRDQ